MTSEETIYNPRVCLSIPLFTYTNSHGSDIQMPEHLHQIHKSQKNMYWMHYNVLHHSFV